MVVITYNISVKEMTKYCIAISLIASIVLRSLHFVCAVLIAYLLIILLQKKKNTIYARQTCCLYGPVIMRQDTHEHNDFSIKCIEL